MSNKYHCNTIELLFKVYARLTRVIITRYNGLCFGKNCTTVEKIVTFAICHRFYSKDYEQNSG